MSYRRFLVMILGLVLATLVSVTSASVQVREIEFTQGNTPIQGILAWDDTVTTRRPGVLVVHGGFGYTNTVRAQARRLAEAGYVGFAFDMYEEGKVETHGEHAGAMMRALNQNPPLIAAKFNAALQELKRDPHVDPTKISAIGYCWGGGVVLDVARRGGDLDAVVAFHGVLDTKTPAQKGSVKARVLVLSGDGDSFAKPEIVEAFRREMQSAGANFTIVLYPGAKHAFTQPYAQQLKSDNLKYDPDIDRQSWAEMLKLLGDVYR